MRSVVIRPRSLASGRSKTNQPSDAQPPSNSDLVAVGSRAPAFTLKTPEGDSVSLSDYRGRAVLLEFFATWCPHCNAEAPHLKTLASSLGQKRFAFLSVKADSEDAARVFADHRYFGLSFPALLDPGTPAGNFHQQGGLGPVTQAYRVQSYPTFYIVDGTGRIAWASDGEQPDALLRKNLVAAASASG
jgi:peroxiredoxin